MRRLVSREQVGAVEALRAARALVGAGVLVGAQVAREVIGTLVHAAADAADVRGAGARGWRGARGELPLGGLGGRGGRGGGSRRGGRLGARRVLGRGERREDVGAGGGVAQDVYAALAVEGHGRGRAEGWDGGRGPGSRGGAGGRAHVSAILAARTSDAGMAKGLVSVSGLDNWWCGTRADKRTLKLETATDRISGVAELEGAREGSLRTDHLAWLWHRRCAPGRCANTA